jgi:hypothetical protein
MSSKAKIVLTSPFATVEDVEKQIAREEASASQISPVVQPTLKENVIISKIYISESKTLPEAAKTKIVFGQKKADKPKKKFFYRRKSKSSRLSVAKKSTSFVTPVKPKPYAE